jgi:membrane protease YdiL (CAAX protease family)
MTAPRYAPLADLAEAARPRAEVWRTVLGLVLIGLGYLGAVFGFFHAMFAVLEPQIGDWAAARFVDSFASGRTAPGLTALLWSFLLLLLPLLLVTRALHRRSLASLMGPPRRALRDAVRVALPLGLLAVAMMPFAVLSDAAGRRHDLGTWLMWLPVALPGLIVQVSAEELLFRGYLQQQLAARFRSAFVWMALPSALFALLHFAPGDFGGNAVLIAVWAGVFGLLAADLTARTGTIGAALGLHLATNFSAIFLVGLWGQLDGLALWNIVVNTRDLGTILPLLAVDLLALVVSWLVARVALRV